MDLRSYIIIFLSLVAIGASAKLLNDLRKLQVISKDGESLSVESFFFCPDLKKFKFLWSDIRRVNINCNMFLHNAFSYRFTPRPVLNWFLAHLHEKQRSCKLCQTWASLTESTSFTLSSGICYHLLLGENRPDYLWN